ncbi:hypothetical protein D9613_011736 [Agrocybe pediades]|uniref:Crinkler effector protein N-terminal domain-containing protein n=1 Tax=Agrocybe pediades TaxID=84607 RepID=A0A8H4VLW2_9AGAR|nr:hypothetical protein D9613_011736 [Agrocybe pediades]
MSFLFSCFFPGEVPLYFALEVNPNIMIYNLRKVIAEELKDLKVNISHLDLILFKTDIPLEPLETRLQRSLQFIHTHRTNVLEMSDAVQQAFPTNPFGDKRLHIIVATEDILEGIDVVGDPYKMKLAKGLEKKFSFPSSGPPPSQVVASAEYIEAFFNATTRPVSMDGVPVAMFSPPLAKLQQHVENLNALKPTNGEILLATRYWACATKWYKDESDREKDIRQHVDSLVGQPGQWQTRLDWAGNNGIKPDAAWWHLLFVLIIFELKNILGIAGDAILQSAVDYEKIVSSAKFKKFSASSNFPAVLLGISGSRIQLAIAVCTGPIYVSNIYTLDLASGFHASAKIMELARVFHAIALCRTDLQAYYDKIFVSHTRYDVTSVFPNPTFVNADAPELIYTHCIARTGEPTSTIPNLVNAATAIYFAKLASSGEEVVVKFTAQYSKAAHQLLADAGFAPKLHFCDMIVGGLYIVVMERIKGKSIWQLLQEKEAIPSLVGKRVEAAISCLHNANLVFGDLRDANVLYSRSDDPAVEGKVFLIDFDWTDKDGEGRYPPTLNISNALAENVTPSGLMRKEDDLWHLDRLKKLCAQDP